MRGHNFTLFFSQINDDDKISLAFEIFQRLKANEIFLYYSVLRANVRPYSHAGFRSVLLPPLGH